MQAPSVYYDRSFTAIVRVSDAFVGNQKTTYHADTRYVTSVYESLETRRLLRIVNIMLGLVSYAIPEPAQSDSSLHPLANGF